MRRISLLLVGMSVCLLPALATTTNAALIVLALWTLVALAFALRSFAAGGTKSALLAVALSLACAVLFAGESAMALLGKPLYRETWSQPLTEPDPLLGTIMRPEVETRHRRRVQSTGFRLEWDVIYRTEDDRSRRVPSRPDDGARIVMFGGSFVFGEGLNDEDTIPERLQCLLAEQRVSSFAVRGHGTAQNYFYLEQVLDRASDVDVCITGFIGDHLRRTAVPYALMASDWGRDHPRAAVRDGRIVHLGRAYDTLTPAEKLHVGLLLRSRLYRRLFASWSPSPADWSLVEELIVGMKTRCEDERVGSTFLWVALPSGTKERGPLSRSEAFLQLRQNLEARGVRTLDLIEAFEDLIVAGDRPRETYFFADGHPTREYARWAAGRIAEAVREVGGRH